MSRIYTVAECDRHIEDAQWVLDNPSNYDFVVRVDADKARTRWSVIRAHAEQIEILQDKLASWEETENARP